MCDVPTDNRTKLIQEAYRLSELRLEAQFRASLASDQRAITLAGVLMAAAAIIAGWANGASLGASIALTISAFLMGLGAVSAWWAAKPRKSRSPGASFRDLSEDIEGDYPYDTVLRQLGGFNDNAVENLRQDAEKGRFCVQIAMILAGASVLVALLAVWL